MRGESAAQPSELAAPILAQRPSTESAPPDVAPASDEIGAYPVGLDLTYSVAERGDMAAGTVRPASGTAAEAHEETAAHELPVAVRMEPSDPRSAEERPRPLVHRRANLGADRRMPLPRTPAQRRDTQDALAEAASHTREAGDRPSSVNLGASTRSHAERHDTPDASADVTSQNRDVGGAPADAPAEDDSTRAPEL